MARSIAQDAASMNAALDGIWRMGDRDECSIKHIGHATAALAAGRDWSEGVDYSTPWSTPVDPSPGLVKVLDQRYAQLGKRWAKVQAKRDEWGTERFDQVMQATKFAWYHSQNLKLYWNEEA